MDLTRYEQMQQALRSRGASETSSLSQRDSNTCRIASTT